MEENNNIYNKRKQIRYFYIINIAKYWSVSEKNPSEKSVVFLRVLSLTTIQIRKFLLLYFA